jgi:hypothetical protein
MPAERFAERHMRQFVTIAIGVVSLAAALVSGYFTLGYALLAAKTMESGLQSTHATWCNIWTIAFWLCLGLFLHAAIMVLRGAFAFQGPAPVTRFTLLDLFFLLTFTGLALALVASINNSVSHLLFRISILAGPAVLVRAALRKNSHAGSRESAVEND